jgi:L-alanine-DL-glutamate epimerase-like enolase superfamily enzyme
VRIVEVEDLHADGGWRIVSFLKITTDEGLVGWSEFCEGMAGPGLTAAIRVLSEKVIGLDPRDVGPIGAMLYAGTRMAEGGANAQAIAAIENACLDIKAKAAGVPVYALLGGAHRHRLPVYWSHCGTFRVRNADLFDTVNGAPRIETLDDVARLGREVVSRGFKALKTNILLIENGHFTQYRPGFAGRGRGHPERGIDPAMLSGIDQLLAAFRDGIGPDTALLLDVNFNFRLEALTRLARATEPHELAWLEVDLYDAEALAALRGGTASPIASLETIYGRRMLRPYLDAGAVDVAIIDPQWNGMMEAVRMAQLVDSYDINVAPHNAHGYLSTTMGIHLGAAIPNFRILEFDVDEVPWMADLVTAPPRIEDGECLVPTGPGWGCDVNEEAVLAHPPKNIGRATWLLDYHRRNSTLG